MADLNKIAYDSIDSKYHCYLVDLRGKPYMTVAGRVAMAVDEHAKVGEKLSMHTKFMEVAGGWVCNALVTSMRGTVTAHAKVPSGANLTGADKSNPIEVAESSAIGRALGFLGYGLVTGIASFEEVEQAQFEQGQETRGSRKVSAVTDFLTNDPVETYEELDDFQAPPPPPVFASPKQTQYLCGLLHQCGVIDQHARRLVNTVYPSLSAGDASLEIESLKGRKDLPDKWFFPYVKMLRTEAGYDFNEFVAYLKANYQTETPAMVQDKQALLADLHEQIKIPRAESGQWSEMVSNIAESSGHATEYVEGWIDATGGRTDVSFRRIQGMSEKEIAKDIGLFIAQVENLGADDGVDDGARFV